MQEGDPFEYRFATTHLQDWTHWQTLCELSWFKPLVTRWREELDLRMKSESLARIIDEARSDRRESLSANKYLLEKGWQPKGSSKDQVGRPSKEKIRNEAERLYQEHSRIGSDVARIGPIKTD